MTSPQFQRGAPKAGNQGYVFATSNDPTRLCVVFVKRGEDLFSRVGPAGLNERRPGEHHEVFVRQQDRTIVRYPDATTHRFQYDPDDHVIADEDNNGLQRLYTFDALERMIRTDLDRSGLTPGVTVEGASFARGRKSCQFADDGGDRDELSS